MIDEWLAQLRPASLDGVPFQVEVYEQGGSARGDVYELENTTRGKVLGLGARRHNIEGTLRGVDVAAQWKNLRAVIENGGGVLVHPLFGEITVQTGPYSINGDKSRTERLDFSFECVEIDPTPHMPAVDEELGITVAVEAARASLLADFLGAFAVGGDFADSILDEAEATVNETLDSIETALSVVDDARAAVARIAEIRDNVRTLLRTPELFFDAILGLFADIADLFAVQTTFNWPPQTLAGSYPTPSHEQADGNSVALRTAIVGTSIARAVELVPDWTFASWDAATQLRDTLVEQMQTEESVASPDVAAAYVDLRVALDAVIESLAGELVPVETLELTEPESAVLLAYRLYGDPERAAEIITNNDVADPLSLFGSIQVATT